MNKPHNNFIRTHNNDASVWSCSVLFGFRKEVHIKDNAIAMNIKPPNIEPEQCGSLCDS